MQGSRHSLTFQTLSVNQVFYALLNLLAAYVLGLLFDPADGGGMFFQNVSEPYQKVVLFKNILIWKMPVPFIYEFLIYMCAI
jgi:hypothetical protein